MFIRKSTHDADIKYLQDRIGQIREDQKDLQTEVKRLKEAAYIETIRGDNQLIKRLGKRPVSDVVEILLDHFGLEIERQPSAIKLKNKDE